MKGLFNQSEFDKDLLYKQYSLFISTAEKNSDRRNQLNTFFIALHSLLVSVLSLFRTEISSYVIPICVFGCALALIWWQMLRNYRRLNRAKYDIIQEIEKHLPLNLFKTEWDLYINKKHICNPLKYLSFSRLEMFLPWLLIAVYCSIIIIKYTNNV